VPAKAWDLTRRGKGIAGYAFLMTTATDSAAAATAMATGQKTYNNAINFSNQGQPLTGQTIAELAKERGKSVGVVTTVPWSHATPAAVGGAHNGSRNNTSQIANEMLQASYLDVIMGAGNPDFDEDGRPRTAARDYQYVGGPETWKQLKSGNHPGGWKLVESKADFEALTAGDTPAKVLGTACAATTLQQKRSAGRGAASARVARRPFGVRGNANVPSLVTMTKAALNCLDGDPDGFFLMVEGGAVDWANHANQPERMIEEQIDFLRAVEAVVSWVEAASDWDQTLVIVTADHECGMLWGPRSDKLPFDPIVNNGKGRMPGVRYNSTEHTNSLVPLYARGATTERFAALVRGTDAAAAKRWDFSGKYVDNTAVFEVMKLHLVPAAEPAEVSVLPGCTDQRDNGRHQFVELPACRYN
jgi:alkaline phosphatase